MGLLSRLFGRARPPRRADVATVAIGLAERLDRQASKFIDSAAEALSKSGADELRSAAGKVSESRVIVRGFQCVHVANFAAAQNYVGPESFGEFFRALAGALNLESPEGRRVLAKWQRSREEPGASPARWSMMLAEDVAMVATGKIGLLLAPAFASLSHQLLVRSLMITADTFGDHATSAEFAEAARKLT